MELAPRPGHAVEPHVTLQGRQPTVRQSLSDNVGAVPNTSDLGCADAGVELDGQAT